MSLTDPRNRYVPHFNDYYDASVSYKSLPYLMLTVSTDIHNKTLNSDSNGIRYSYYNGKAMPIQGSYDLESVNILIGGSTVYGIGASSDANTISSKLSQKTGECWLNFGLTACNSLQEYINFIRFMANFKKINNIVFFSGSNDIYLNILSKKDSGFDPRTGEESGNLFFYSLKRRLFASLFSKIYNVPIADIIELRPKEIALYGFKHVHKRELTLENKITRLESIFKRNFILYSSLKKQFNANVLFVRQPFLTCIDKELSKEEKEIMDFLDNAPKNRTFRKVKNMITKEVSEKISIIYESLSKELDIGFIDSNPLFEKSKGFMFLDRVHLTDMGNDFASDLILKGLKKC